LIQYLLLTYQKKLCYAKAVELDRHISLTLILNVNTGKREILQMNG